MIHSWLWRKYEPRNLSEIKLLVLKCHQRKQEMCSQWMSWLLYLLGSVDQRVNLVSMTSPMATDPGPRMCVLSLFIDSSATNIDLLIRWMESGANMGKWGKQPLIRTYVQANEISNDEQNRSKEPHQCFEFTPHEIHPCGVNSYIFVWDGAGIEMKYSSKNYDRIFDSHV